MWPRILEVLLGLWLVASPWILGSGEGAGSRAVNWAAGALVVLLSASTFAERFRHAHVGNLALAVFLIAWGWTQAARPGPPWAQNLILVGLVLGLVAIVPTQASRPPRGWRRYVSEQE